MTKPVFRPSLGLALSLAVIGLCLFADCAVIKESHIFAAVLAEVAAVLRDPGTQWMVVLCAGMYCLGFVVLRSRLAGAGKTGTRWNASLPDEGWLAGLLVLAGVAYTLDYAGAVKATQALTLLGGAMIAQGAGLWESKKQKVESRNGARGTVVGVLVALLLGAAMWQAETEYLFRYRGQARSAGPWDNPNTFGMLMGVGLVLAVGKLVQSLKPKVQIRPSAEFGVRSAEHPTSNIQHPILNWGLWVKNAFFLGATAVMGVGLVKSYSRGASVGAAVGLAYLIVNAEQKAEMGRGKAEKLNTETLQAARRRVALAIIAVSIGVLAFWSCRHTERALARRAYTVANANDFSWRNRVVAYEGALQMLAEKPWFGFGWNQPERVYDRYYRAAKVDEGMAIQLNDYLTLGTTLGLPALLCFATYIGLSLSPRSKVQSPKPEVQSAKDADQQPADGRQRTALPPPPTLDFRLWTLDSGAVCRAGAAVLLVGFWFDGGLFKLATGSTFWILLELGKAGTDCTDEQA